MRNLQDYIDSYGCIRQADGDGGDSCNYHGLYWFALGILNRFSWELFVTGLTNFFVKKANGAIYWIRHPNPAYWWSQEGAGGSQDQCIAIIACFSFVHSKTVLIEKMLKPLLKRFGFFWNTRKIGETTGWKIPDFISPTTIGCIIRALGLDLLKPVLWLTDLFLILNVTIRLIAAKIDTENTGDDSNLQVLLFQAHFYMPTVSSFIASKIYLKRPLARFKDHPELNADLSTFGPQSALDLDYHPIFKGPPLNDLWREVWKNTGYLK